jgi:uncharacterized repeat protein (TIGR01451 family)
MKGFFRSKLFLALVTLVMLTGTILVPLSGSIPRAHAASRSSKNIGYANYDDSGFTESGVASANIFATSIVSGPTPTSSTTASVTYNGMTFTPLTRAALSSTTLAPFDTLILFEVCDIATSLTASQHDALNAYLAAGNKILLYDADRCAPSAAGNGAVGNADYSWFTFPFATSNPGPQGASGTLTVVENSSLTQGLSSDPFNSDELGDANTATTSDPHWFAAAKTTNTLGNNGFFLAYARNSGLIIYDGADHWFTVGPTKSLTDLFLNELNQQYDPDNLPGSIPIAPSPSPSVSPSPSPSPSPTPVTLSFTKAAAPTVKAGGTLTYTLTLTNNGPIEAHGIHLADTLPTGLTAFTTPTFTVTRGTASVDCSASTTTAVSCTIDNVTVGGTVTITFSASVSKTATGTITNKATAVSTTTPANVTATAKTTIIVPTPKPITITASCPAQTPIPLPSFKAGDTLIGTVTFTTTDPNDISQNQILVLTDTFTGQQFPFAPTLTPTAQPIPLIFTLAAKSSLVACIQFHDGDETGIVTITGLKSPPPPSTHPDLERLVVYVKIDGLNIPIPIALNSLESLSKKFAVASCTIGVITKEPKECIDLVLKTLGKTLGVIGEGFQLLGVAVSAYACLYVPAVGVPGVALKVLACATVGVDALKELIFPGHH